MYKRQVQDYKAIRPWIMITDEASFVRENTVLWVGLGAYTCLLYTSDAADERSSVDLGGRRIIKKKTNPS